jgi:outer membrane cobalamin receptor
MPAPRWALRPSARVTQRLAFALAALLTGAAQAEGPGSLSGQVLDPDGRALALVPLRLEGAAGTRRFVSSATGRFHVEALPPGDYRLAAELPGFVASDSGSVSIDASASHYELRLAPAPVREQVVVTATRGAAPASILGVSISALDAAQIEARHATSLLGLLQDLPGVAVARAGGPGLQASAFVRGGDSRYARVLIDGVPVNQPGGAFDLGDALPFELERIEVVRGAASSLYGTDALAGVIQLVTQRAEPGAAPSLRAEAEGGSFAWRRAQAGLSGAHAATTFNVSLQHLDTDNEQPNSAFRQNSAAATLGFELGRDLNLRFVGRASDSRVGTPGPTAFGRPDLEERFERSDLTLGAQARVSFERGAYVVRVGYAKSDQLTRDPGDSGTYLPRFGTRVAPFGLSDFVDPVGFRNDTARLSVGHQLDLAWGARQLVTLGIDVERETGTLGGAGETPLEPRRTNGGLYVQDRLVLGTRAFVTLGARLERNDSFGWSAVPRAALALRLREGATATTLKASAGAGIKEPSFFESFGVSFFARGNLDLKPERSRTFDLGLEQRLWAGRLRAEATLFQHSYLDQIAYRTLDFQTFAGSYVNLGKTRARGLELQATAAPTPGLALSAAYTWLDGEILVSTSDFDPIYAVGQGLLRRPRHQLALGAQAQVGKLALGATLAHVGRRADSDFLGLNLNTSAAYTRFDARLTWRLGTRLEAFGVAENLLDRDYMDVLGYPALGRSLRAGLRLRSALR